MEIVSFLADLAAVAGALVSVAVYYDTVNRDRKISTIAKYSELREKFPANIEDLDEEGKLAYLKELEFFCTGINERVYDLRILRKMCGKRLIRQYDSVMKDFVEERRRVSQTASRAWTEYETT
ncbi:MAG: hypothetical protein IIX85_03315, partial [Clostridia bacterium]|nr:hypothetical protein [Clostridia bacterium]